MATDVEESDTDDRERPAPPKRQCTRLVTYNDTFWDTVMQCSAILNEKGIAYDDAEKQANEKLKKWQACQVAQGFIDNAVNKLLENCTSGIPTFDVLEESISQLFARNDMVDTAVTMAIRNHGLVQMNELIPQSSAFSSDKASGYWTNEYTDIHCSCPSNQIKSVGNFGSSMATASTNSLKLNDSADTKRHNPYYWDLDKIDESDQQENFIERAVAEAIKKKGLSTLSVDMVE